MELKLTKKQFRYLLDLVYAGNWVINSIRGDDRIAEYDDVESRVFAACLQAGMEALVEFSPEAVPSRKYVQGGIHEAIMDYEDMVFYGILAEELARRDLHDHDIDGADSELLVRKIEEYMTEFSANGLENISVNGL